MKERLRPLLQWAALFLLLFFLLLAVRRIFS